MKTKNQILHQMIKAAILATMTISIAQTASADIFEDAKTFGQGFIDAHRQPAKKVLPRQVTKHTDKLADAAIEKRKKAEAALGKFAYDPVAYLMQLPLSLASDLCSAPVQYYSKVQQEQARGHWKHLPQELIEALQDDYAVDLSSVQYVENVTTSNGQAQTIGTRIYFPVSINLHDHGQLQWMLHELEHTVQFANATFGDAGKLCEYVAKAVGSGFRHDAIDMERAADAKSQSLIDEAMAAMNGAYASSGSPQTGHANNALTITNTTDIEITFDMGTDSLSSGPAYLPPGQTAVFNGNVGDAQYYVHIGTQTWRGPISRNYTIQGGGEMIIARSPHGIFEFYNAR